MKFSKKNQEQPVKETNEAADDVMQELDSDAVQQISGGAGNPFANVPRANNKPIDDKLRNNG